MPESKQGCAKQTCVLLWCQGRARGHVPQMHLPRGSSKARKSDSASLITCMGVGVRQMRAKHDIYNSVYAGCAAGAVLAHSAGPKGMCIGCASFAAFSALIDKIMEHD